METTGRVMFAGKDADALAAKGGLEIVPPEYFITPRRLEALRRAMAGTFEPQDRYGTVGAVALDKAGNLAAATSTGGMNAKPPGRIGDCADHRRRNLCRQRLAALSRPRATANTSSASASPA